jgi:hypothetical protein
MAKAKRAVRRTKRQKITKFDLAEELVDVATTLKNVSAVVTKLSRLIPRELIK